MLAARYYADPRLVAPAIDNSLLPVQFADVYPSSGKSFWRRTRRCDNIGVVSNSLRDAPPSVWPALRRPDGAGKLVHLDQKHWVHLAQADTGHPDGTCYAAALQAARAARGAGTAVFPLSMVHYSETLKITSVRHRSDLGAAILSGRRNPRLAVDTR